MKSQIPSAVYSVFIFPVLESLPSIFVTHWAMAGLCLRLSSVQMCQWGETLDSVPEISLSSSIWPWHSVLRFIRRSSSFIVQCSFLKRKLQQNRIVMIHMGSNRENSNRMQKSFHLSLKHFKVTEMEPIFPMIPHSTARLTAINSSLTLVSQDRVFSFRKRVSLKHFGGSRWGQCYSYTWGMLGLRYVKTKDTVFPQK